MMIHNVYTAVACNPTPESLDWGDHNRIIYAASNAIVIYDPLQKRVIRTVCAHKARVNTVKWVPAPDAHDAADHQPATFITGSDDHLGAVHHIRDVRDAHCAVTTHKLAGHTGGVKLVDSVRIGGGALLVATAASDGTLKLWRGAGYLSDVSAAFECFQSIEFTTDLCLSLRMCVLPPTEQQHSAASVLLAVGAGEMVRIYRRADESEEFESLQTLAGHEDWVRGLDFAHNDGELLLASSSQDTFIRLWKATTTTTANTPRFALESVLSGHDGWVYSVQWSRDRRDGSLQLLSSSMDKTMILWQSAGDDDDDIWTETVRVGDIGGHFLGFFGAKMSPTCGSLLGHGYHGSFHLWQQQSEVAAPGEKLVDAKSPVQRWQPGVLGIGGHFSEARDLVWEPRGSFVVSVSADQTTRVHAPCTSAVDNGTTSLWYELARPQVHGYDMQTIAVLGRYRFASGAEEKIVRTFQASGGFVQSLRIVCGVQAETDAEGDSILNSKSSGATLPSLGLSNQATSESMEAAVADADGAEIAIEPPTEETLMQNTLWPETQKLYGHGYEVYSLCATSDGKLLASACKATNTEHAQILLWNTHTWKQHQHLVAHQLTITQMCFSPDDRYLLSVSRDRRWSVFERNDADAVRPDLTTAEYVLLETTNKQNGVHTRIIWTCDWSPDSQYFATGSRDGKCVMWHAVDAQHPRSDRSTLLHFTAVDVLELAGDSVTAVAFARQRATDNAYVVAVGTHAGLIRLCRFAADAWRELAVLDSSDAHHGTVRRLAFRPVDAGEHITLASCGNDHFVRVYEISC